MMPLMNLRRVALNSCSGERQSFRKQIFISINLIIMKSIIIALIALVAISSAVTICDKYANASATPQQLNLMTAVVTGVFGDVTASGTPTARFFDGSIPGTRNFTNNPNNITTILANHLIQFFGYVLGCSDPNFPAYQGNLNMQVVHAALPINNVSFNFFNQQVINVVASAGVTSGDQASILAVLETERINICNQPDCGNPLITTGAAPITTGIASITTSIVATTAHTAGFNLLAPFVAIIAGSLALFL